MHNLVRNQPNIAVVNQAQSTKQQVYGPGSLFLLGPKYYPKKERTYVLFFVLSFIFSFILHPTCILSLFISSFLSLFPLDSFVYSWQKGGEYTREYTRVYHHFYMTHEHIFTESYSISCIFVGVESHRGDAYTKGEKSFLFKKTLVCLFYSLFVFLFCFMMLWVMFSFHALLFSLHRVYVLDTHTSLCYCTLLVACSDGHLLAKCSL